jgi:hypothetical protein
MLYLRNLESEGLAREALGQSLTFDRRLQLAEPTGNNLRWKAVLEVIGARPDLKSALGLIDESKDMFVPGGLYEAHLINSRGIIYLGTRKRAHGRDLLEEAADRLSWFADARGLALVLYLLSNSKSRPSDKIQKSFRRMLAAGALHPHGFLLERCSWEAKRAGAHRLLKEIDNLLDDQNKDYRAVHQMMRQLGYNSPHEPNDLLHRNIGLLLGNDFPYLKLPFARFHHLPEAGDV